MQFLLCETSEVVLFDLEIGIAECHWCDCAKRKNDLELFVSITQKVSHSKNERISARMKQKAHYASIENV